jgi:hypothetical protein
MATVLLVVLLLVSAASAHSDRPWTRSNVAVPQHDPSSPVARGVAAAAAVSRSYNSSTSLEQLAVGCHECKLIMAEVQSIVQANATIQELMKFAIAVCIDLKIQDEVVVCALHGYQ